MSDIKIIQVIVIDGDIVGLLNDGSLVYWSSSQKDWNPYLPGYSELTTQEKQ